MVGVVLGFVLLRRRRPVGDRFLGRLQRMIGWAGGMRGSLTSCRKLAAEISQSERDQGGLRGGVVYWANAVATKQNQNKVAEIIWRNNCLRGKRYNGGTSGLFAKRNDFNP